MHTFYIICTTPHGQRPHILHVHLPRATQHTLYTWTTDTIFHTHVNIHMLPATYSTQTTYHIHTLYTYYIYTIYATLIPNAITIHISHTPDMYVLHIHTYIHHTIHITHFHHTHLHFTHVCTHFPVQWSPPAHSSVWSRMPSSGFSGLPALLLSDLFDSRLLSAMYYVAIGHIGQGTNGLA